MNASALNVGYGGALLATYDIFKFAKPGPRPTAGPLAGLDPGDILGLAGLQLF